MLIKQPCGNGSYIEGLTGKIVGVQQGNIADLWVEDNVETEELKQYTKFAQAAEDLKNEKIDCVVMDQYPAEELWQQIQSMILDGVLFEDKYAIAVQKGNKELLDEINTVIQKLKDEGKIEEFYAIIHANLSSKRCHLAYIIAGAVNFMSSPYIMLSLDLHSFEYNEEVNQYIFSVRRKEGI